MIAVIARHEFARLVRTPLAWGLAAAGQLLAGLFFNAYVQSFLATQAEARGQFSVTAQVVGPLTGVLSLVFLLLLPLLTMNSLAGERRAGSLPLLLSAPVGAGRIVLGKYLGLMAWVSLFWLMLCALPASLLLAGRLDGAQALLALAGLWLMAACVCAIGLAASAWCRQGAAAAGATLAVLLPLWLVESATLHVRGLTLFGAETLSLLGHYRGLREGLLDSRDPLYYLLVIGAALAVATAGLRRDTQPRRHYLPRLLLSLALVAVLLPLNQLVHIRRDLSANGWNSLSSATRSLLAELPAAPVLTAYFSDPQERGRLARLLAPYAAERPDFVLRYADPAQAEGDGQPAGSALSLSLGARREALSWPFTDTAERVLAPALARLARAKERWIVFVEGHGERAPFGAAPRDLGDFRQRLTARGLSVRALALHRLDAIPDNTAVLVLASPDAALPEREQRLVTDYLARGGALLLLLEPEPAPVPQVLLAALGVTRLAGTVVDTDGHRRGTPHPAVVLVDKPETHALTRGLHSLLALPWPAALDARPDGPWHATPLLRSPASTWAELGSLDGELKQDREFGETSGPQSLALALTRPQDVTEQRVLVFGDGNFLSTGAIGNYGNAALGLAAIDWLVQETGGPELPAMARVDPSLEPDPVFLALVRYGFPWGLSGTLLVLAMLIPLWRRR